MSKSIRTDKLDTAAALLEDCIVGFFAGNSIQTTIHLAFAVMTVVRDLNNHYKKTNVDLNFSTISSRIKEETALKELFQKNQTRPEEYNISIIDRANFVKHANMEPLSDNLYVGIEDDLILTIAIEDFGNFYYALREKALCCQVSAIQEHPHIAEPKFQRLARLFYQYKDEYQKIAALPEKKSDWQTDLIVREELKRKYSDIVRQMDLAAGRSQNDQLILIDSLLNGPTTKPTAPARLQP